MLQFVLLDNIHQPNFNAECASATALAALQLVQTPVTSAMSATSFRQTRHNALSVPQVALPALMLHHALPVQGL